MLYKMVTVKFLSLRGEKPLFCHFKWRNEKAYLISLSHFEGITCIFNCWLCKTLPRKNRYLFLFIIYDILFFTFPRYLTLYVWMLHIQLDNIIHCQRRQIWESWGPWLPNSQFWITRNLKLHFNSQSIMNFGGNFVIRVKALFWRTS